MIISRFSTTMIVFVTVGRFYQAAIIRLFIFKVPWYELDLASMEALELPRLLWQDSSKRKKPINVFSQLSGHIRLFRPFNLKPLEIWASDQLSLISVRYSKSLKLLKYCHERTSKLINYQLRSLWHTLLGPFNPYLSPRKLSYASILK